MSGYALRWRLVADRFDIVPIRTYDKCGEIVGVVLRPWAGRAVVFASRFKRSAIEGSNLLTTVRGERQVEVRRLFLESANAKRCRTVRPAQFQAKRSFRDHCHTERCKSPDEEGLALFIVADSEDYVIKHAGRGVGGGVRG